MISPRTSSQINEVYGIQARLLNKREMRCLNAVVCANFAAQFETGIWRVEYVLLYKFSKKGNCDGEAVEQHLRLHDVEEDKRLLVTKLNREISMAGEDNRIQDAGRASS